jgi:Zn-dependent peptidase ImmA (M78 family)
MNILQDLLRTRNRKKDVDLIQRTGISKDRIDQLLNDGEPNLEELRTLADFFRVDLRDLLPTHPRHQSFRLLFRSGGAEVDDVTSSALSRRIGYSVELLGPGRESRPAWIEKFSRQGQEYEDAEANANTFRKLFLSDDQLSPLFGLPGLVPEALGILVFIVRTSRFEGASAYVEGLPFVFLTETFGPRMLFTLAHEIGHILAHHDPHQEFAIVDTQTETRPQASKNATEFYAHAFASCLLMPKQGIVLTLRKIREMQQPNKELGDLELLLLARIYGVSFYAAAKRCEDLDLLPRGGAASLTELLTKEYGSPEKRAEAANLPPRPKSEFPKMPVPLLRAALDQVRSGQISVGKASSILGLSIADLLEANAPRAN